MSLSAYEIDRAIPRIQWRGLTIPQTFSATLEHSRTTHGEAPEMYVAHWHARIRWSRFCLMWAALGAQMGLDAE